MSDDAVKVGFYVVDVVAVVVFVVAAVVVVVVAGVVAVIAVVVCFSSCNKDRQMLMGLPPSLQVYKILHTIE